MSAVPNWNRSSRSREDVGPYLPGLQSIGSEFLYKYEYRKCSDRLLLPNHESMPASSDQCRACSCSGI
jgi:hypothetical protein